MRLQVIPRALWTRKWLLLACVGAAALAALPIALMGPSVFSSTTTVVAPPTLPLPRAQSPGQTTSVLAVRMASYLESGLQRDVKEAMGPEGREVEVTGEQDADLATYLLTAESTRPAVAKTAAEVAGRMVITKADEFSDELVQSLTEKVKEDLRPVVGRLRDARDRQETLTVQVQDLERKRASLTAQLTSAEQSAVRAESLGDGGAAATFRERAQEAEEEIDALDEKLTKLELQLATATSEAALLEARYSTLTAVTEEAAAISLSRLAASAVTAAPSQPDDTDIEEVLLTEGLAILSGLLLGAAYVTFIEWRRSRRASKAIALEQRREKMTVGAGAK